MPIRKITGVTNRYWKRYVCFEKDPRKIPLNQCASFGDLMATLERCKELDRKDKKDKKHGRT
jgi:hypothetical protein